MEAGALAIGTVAVVDKQTDNCDGGGDDLVGQEQNTAVAREDAVAGDAAEQHAEINPGRDRPSGPNGHGG
jgi:hypothetical protein